MLIENLHFSKGQNLIRNRKFFQYLKIFVRKNIYFGTKFQTRIFVQTKRGQVDRESGPFSVTSIVYNFL